MRVMQHVKCVYDVSCIFITCTCDMTSFGFLVSSESFEISASSDCLAFRIKGTFSGLISLEDPPQGKRYK